MKDGKMVLIAQPLLESRTCAYLEWLANEVTMTANKTDLKYVLLVMLFVNKKENNKPILPIISLRVRRLFPLVG